MREENAKYVKWGQGIWHREKVGTASTLCQLKVKRNYITESKPPSLEQWCAICYFTEKRQIFSV